LAIDYERSLFSLFFSSSFLQSTYNILKQLTLRLINKILMELGTEYSTSNSHERSIIQSLLRIKAETLILKILRKNLVVAKCSKIYWSYFVFNFVRNIGSTSEVARLIKIQTTQKNIVLKIFFRFDNGVWLLNRMSFKSLILNRKEK